MKTHKQESTREPIEPLKDLLNGFLAVRRATAYVEWYDDPKIPGRRGYTITGATKEAVQAAVTARLQTMDDMNGVGHFIGPYRAGDGWMAKGETIAAQGQPCSEKP